MNRLADIRIWLNGTFRDQKNLIRMRGVLSGERAVCQKVNLTKPEFLSLEDAVSLCDCRVASLQMCYEATCNSHSKLAEFVRSPLFISFLRSVVLIP